MVLRNGMPGCEDCEANSAGVCARHGTAARQSRPAISGVNVATVGEWVELTVYRGGVPTMRYRVLREDASALGRALRVALPLE